ncbi:MAG: methyltransferase [Alphaproteobacteria bacterium]|nr:methyltransferase [Alphaproteobacteria bacterium]
MIGMGETADTLLAGRVRLAQADQGYRVSVDAVLLAAAVRIEAGQRALDVGCGVGGATLCLASRVPGAILRGVDQDPQCLERLRRNAAANGFEDQIAIEDADVANGTPSHLRQAFDHVFSNPPYLPAARADTRPRAKAANAANIETVPLSAWLTFMADSVGPCGGLTLIHRADRLEEVLGELSKHAGAIRVIPVWPRAGQPASRVIVTARKEVATPTVLDPGLVLHENDGSFSPAARAILEDGAPLALP